MQELSTGFLSAVAVTDNGDGTVEFTATAATGLSVGELVWFDGTTDNVDKYPDVYPVTAVDDAGPYDAVQKTKKGRISFWEYFSLPFWGSNGLSPGGSIMLSMIKLFI